MLNLLCGVAAIYAVFQGAHQWVLALLIASTISDFLDGFLARSLNASSEIGVQLDSLADLVSFGLVSAAMVFSILEQSEPSTGFWEGFLKGSVLIIPALAAIRLARFNVGEKGGDFMGIPVPAFGIFWLGVYFGIMEQGTLFGETPGIWFLWGVMLLTAIMMVVPLPMLSLKFSHYRLRGNFARYLLIALSIIIFLFTGVPGLSLIILVYILISLARIVLT